MVLVMYFAKSFVLAILWIVRAFSRGERFRREGAAKSKSSSEDRVVDGRR